jgi:hypothetical protein
MQYGGKLPAKGTMPIYTDDEQGTLRTIVEQERKEWCFRCDWAIRVLMKEEQSPTVDEGIWLHSLRYELLNDPPVIMQTTIPEFVKVCDITLPDFDALALEMEGIDEEIKTAADDEEECE